ncbi:MAG: c-type cytochrome [Burkholderiales bacterium]
MVPRLLAVVMFAVHAAAYCGQDEFPEFADPRLQLGRKIWLSTCRTCHATDLAGAPRITDKAAWAPRVKKGKDALYQHALQGLFGPAGTEMPPRGGNDALTDDEVKAAVDYMVTVVAQ